METGVEIWENPTNSLVVTVKTDHLGQETRVQTRGGKQLHITPGDRALNEERIHDDKQNPFKNGFLAPVKLLDDDDPDAAAENPNHLTEDGLQELLSAPARDFAERLGKITSEPLLRRLRTLARDGDVRPKRQEAIQFRLDQVTPAKKIQNDRADAEVPSKSGREERIGRAVPVQ
jgi:hypothetical protein